MLSSDPAPIRVLVVDDDPGFLAAVSEALDAAGLAVVAGAGSVSSALELLDRHRPDVAVVDVRMRGGGGERVAREVRARQARTRVVALSAYGDERTVRRMLAAGADRYVVKGGSVEDLLEAVRAVAAAGASG